MDESRETASKSARLRLTSSSGTPFDLLVPSTSRTTSVFVMSIHKAGSVLLDRVIHELGREADYPVLSIEPATFRQGIALNDWPQRVFDLMNAPGYIFSGFRSLGNLESVPAFASAPKVFLVRDLRDMVTSYYFSMAQSHSVPSKGATKEAILRNRERAVQSDINEYVLQGHAEWLFKNLRRYVAFLKRHEVKLYRYEDIIFEKRAWVRDINEHLGLGIEGVKLDEIADRHDVRPTKEDPSKHVRQVTPGNFMKHLSTESIAYIEGECGDLLDFFSYTKARPTPGGGP